MKIENIKVCAFDAYGTCFDINSAAEKMFTLCDVLSFLKISIVVGKSLPHPEEVFSMLPNHPK